MNLQFKQGTSLENLQQVTKDPGTIYLLKGLNEMFVDVSNSSRIKVTDTNAIRFDIEDFIIFGEIEDLALNTSVLDYSYLK